jgi:hypothetical protein
MKKLTILLFSILISFNSYGEWTKVLERSSSTLYLDHGAVKKHGDTIFWWSMLDLAKPEDGTGWLSSTAYHQGDCAVHKYKILALNTYIKPMAKGPQESHDIPSKWRYPEPLTTKRVILEALCPERP